jgi:hypothetical protein
MIREAARRGIDDLHAPLGLDKPAAGRPILHSVAAAVLGIATAAIVIGATAWYEAPIRSLPMPPQIATPAAAKSEPVLAVTAPPTPRVQIPATAPPARPTPQVTGSIPQGIDAGKPLDTSEDRPTAAPGRGDRIITIIDGRSGARQEVRIPAGADAASAPLADPDLGDLARTFPSADDAPEPPPQPSRAKPASQKRAAKPGPAMSTNSVLQAPLR